MIASSVGFPCNPRRFLTTVVAVIGIHSGKFRFFVAWFLSNQLVCMAGSWYKLFLSHKITLQNAINIQPVNWES